VLAALFSIGWTTVKPPAPLAGLIFIEIWFVISLISNPLTSQLLFN
jgi:hypothetical protein